MAGYKDLLLKSAGALLDPYDTWFPQMVESYQARSAWEETHPPERMKEPGIYEAKPKLDPVRGFLAEMVPPDPRVDPEGFRKRVHEELMFAPLYAMPPLAATRVAPSMGINLLKRAGTKVPKHLEKSLLVGAKQYAKEWGSGIFEGLTKDNIIFHGMMDYGPAGKRALFTVVKEGHPMHGSTFSGSQIKKALEVTFQEGLKKKKTKIFVARPGQTQHLDIFQSLPADLQKEVTAGYMVGNKFVPKAVLEKPAKGMQTILEKAPGTARRGVVDPATGEVIAENVAAKDLTELVRRGHEGILRKGLTAFTEREPLSKVIIEASPGMRSLYNKVTKSIKLYPPLRKDLMHELGHYRAQVIPIQRYYEFPAWKKASGRLKKYAEDNWKSWYMKHGKEGEALERELAKELMTELQNPTAYTKPEFVKGVLESPETVKVVSSMQRALHNIGPNQDTPIINTLKKLRILSEGLPGPKKEIGPVLERFRKELNAYRNQAKYVNLTKEEKLYLRELARKAAKEKKLSTK